MSSDSPSPGKYSPDDSLPEVTPPSAGFILQLFVIPAAIVMAIILVWFLFSWLAQMGGDPKDYVLEIQKNKANSWQVAYNLSTELRRDPRYRNDVELSNELASMLEARLRDSLPSDERQRTNELMLRVFLAKALGEFEVADRSVPVLLRASTTGGNEAMTVRMAAIEALALLADNVGGARLRGRSTALVPMLIDSTRGREELAERAAFALAIVGGDEAIEQLERLVRGGSVASVRYNAATGLARHGNVAALPALIEMVEPVDLSQIKNEQDRRAEEHRLGLLALNGLRAARQLAEQNDTDDLSDLSQAVELLLESDPQRQIAYEAADVRDLLRQRTLRGRQSVVPDSETVPAA